MPACVELEGDRDWSVGSYTVGMAGDEYTDENTFMVVVLLILLFEESRSKSPPNKSTSDECKQDDSAGVADSSLRESESPG